MKRLALLLAVVSSPALASSNYTQDARDLTAAALCGPLNTTCQLSYTNGSKDGTAASVRVRTRYKAIRAAEVVPPPPPPPPPPPSPPPPSPPPPPTGTIPTPGLASIASNFDVNAELVASWGNGAIPGSAAPDNVGAFRFICSAGQLSYDDPIVYPGQPGKSHLHQFYGNLSADANSTYASLRTSGNSSCMSPLNRSAYWMPAVLNNKGQVVRPDYVSIYYKRHPKTHPLCAQVGKACVDLPRGLKMIFGFDMLNTSGPSTGGGYFNCQGATAIPGRYANLVLAQAKCPAGNQIGAVISSPDCWDGKNLDSADHRSHVSYMRFDSMSGQNSCPATHPYLMPQFTMGTWTLTDGSPLRLSSDEMRPDLPAGSTFHTDWFGAWDDTVMQMWHDNCIDKLLNCSGGDLGNGKQLKGNPTFIASPRLVAIPTRP